MVKTVHAIRLAILESLAKSLLVRTAEPTPDMSDMASVSGFHAQGMENGALLGVYHFNAQQVRALAPPGGTIVDLGCGSGQCLAHMAQAMPDLNFIGIDLSEQMVEVGNRELRAKGLSGRVELRVGDMTAFMAALPQRVDVLTSIFSLHHLPDQTALRACVGEMASVHKSKGASIWIFDHARPRLRSTAESFPAVFTPDAPEAFKMDSTNSLIASWSFDDLTKSLERAFAHRQAKHSLARILRLYQVHWINVAHESLAPIATLGMQAVSPMSQRMRKDAIALTKLFSELPCKP